MKIKPITHYWVDLVALLSFILSAASGLILGSYAPSHGLCKGAQAFLNISKHSWKELHKWSSLFFIIIIFIHLILHWQWIVHMTKKALTRKT